MTSVGRQLTRSVVCHLRQPRWNRLLLKSNMNLHLLSICQQKRFSKKSDDDCDPCKKQEKKNCTDYKKNPCIEGHKPPEMPDPEPVCAQIRIAKRRKFLEEKKCKEQAAKEKCDDNPCASFSRAALIRGKRRVRLSVSWNKVNGCLLYLSRLRSPVNLNHERMFCKKVVKEKCSAAEPSAKPPVPPKSSRIIRKRNHLLAKQQREAEAKAKTPVKTQEIGTQNLDEAFDQLKLKQACIVNTQIKECKQKPVKSLCEDFKVSKGKDEQQMEAEAKTKTPAKTQEIGKQNPDEAFDQLELKQAYMVNTQIKECEQKQWKSLCEDLKASKGKSEATPSDNLIKCMLTGIKKACALHAQKMDCEHKYAKEIAAEKAAKLKLAKPIYFTKPQEKTKMSPAEKKKALEAAELKRLLQEIKEKCRKKREELETKCKKKADEAALKKKCQEANLKKQTEESNFKK